MDYSIDIPTALTPAEAQVLRNEALGRPVLEVGSLLGHSTVVLAQEAVYVVSVDPHEGYPENDPRPTLQPFLENLKRYNVRDRVVVCVDKYEKVLPCLQRGQFGLVFVDITGKFDDILSCLRMARPLIYNGGTLAVHDCGHPDWPGAELAVQVFAAENQLIYRTVDRMAIFSQLRE